MAKPTSGETAAGSTTLDLPALDITGEHVLVGESGGRSRVYDTRHNSLLDGFVTVETEHGALLLDDDREITYTVELS